MTQKDLGEACGFSQTVISNYEVGIRNPDLETIKKIVRALQDKGVVVTLDDLFSVAQVAA